MTVRGGKKPRPDAVLGRQFKSDESCPRMACIWNPEEWNPSSLTAPYFVDGRLDALLVGNSGVMHRLKSAIATIASSDARS